MSKYPSYQNQFNSLDQKQRGILNKIPYLEDIDGWLLLAEACELFSLSDQIKSPNPIICEIGTWKGKSTYVFASAIKNKHGKVYAIDPFNGDGDGASKDTYQEEVKKMGLTLLDNFNNTIARYGLSNHIEVLPMLSEYARQKFSESKIDLLFIDGNHEYESVKKDFDLWTSLIVPEGIIVLHDVKAIHVDGPKRVMDECLINNSSWKNVRIVGEMGVATKV